MICLNGFYGTECSQPRRHGSVSQLISPFAPHIAEELWAKAISNIEPKTAETFLVNQKWPTFNPALVVDNEITMGVQINGKHRGEITVTKDAAQDVAVSAARPRTALLRPLKAKRLKRLFTFQIEFSIL